MNGRRRRANDRKKLLIGASLFAGDAAVNVVAFYLLSPHGLQIPHLGICLGLAAMVTIVAYLIVEA